MLSLPHFSYVITLLDKEDNFETCLSVLEVQKESFVVHIKAAELCRPY